MSQTQLHENKDFRNQQEKNVCREGSYQNKRQTQKVCPILTVPEAERLKPEAYFSAATRLPSRDL